MSWKILEKLRWALPFIFVKEHIIGMLPLFAALLLEAGIRFSLLQANAQGLVLEESRSITVVIFQLLCEFLPFFIAHFYLINKNKRHLQGQTKKYLAWFGGFVVYPIICLIFINNVESYAAWALISVEGWLFMLVASLGTLLVEQKSSSVQPIQEPSKLTVWFKQLASLDGSLILLLFVWAFMISGVFLNEADPMRNQPLPWKIDFSLIAAEFGRFISYFLQFSLMGLCAAFIFGLNRYVLIRRLLAEQGIFMFLCGALVAIMVLAPIFAHIILAMPINVPEQTLLPSEDHNPYAAINYQVVFWILVFSTPVILAYERQQQGKVLAQITSERTQSELQLLQQQVNPHFLFNTLNNLYALTLSKADSAPDMVMKLSDLLRYTVYEGQKSLVSLSQELDYLQNYISLQQIRFGEELSLSIRFPDESNRWQLPPLLLVILIENAFKHGIEKVQGNSQLSVDVQIERNIMTMCCTNSIPGDFRVNGDGVGVANLKRRLRLLQPTRGHFTGRETADSQWVSVLSLELTPC